MSDKGESLEDIQAAIADRNLHSQTGASTTPGSSASAGSSLSARSSALAGSSTPAGGNAPPVSGTSRSGGGHTGRGRKKAEEAQVLTLVNSFVFIYLHRQTNILNIEY